jgi:hypothetical protein
MWVLDQLPKPIVICAPAEPRHAVTDGDHVGPCTLCGAPIRMYPGWRDYQSSPICLLCYLVHGTPDVPTC